MAQFNVFVGRQQVLSQITDLVDGTSDYNQLVLIGGDGGVGKTFLLQKIAKDYKAKGYLVDYYDLAEQPSGHMRETIHLKDFLGKENFPNFEYKLNDFARGDIADPNLPQLEKDVVGTCLQELNSLIAKTGKKFIRLMDTFELSLSQQIGDKGLFEVQEQITNTLFIVAGRNIQSFVPDFRSSFAKENITEIELKGFDEEEAAEFFGILDESHQIPSDLQEKLNFLTNGRPVLLALSIEWLKHKIPLPEIIGKSLDELRKWKMTKEWETLNSRFEFDLVDSVRSLKSPSEKAVLYMAQITKRFDERILAALLDLPAEDARKLFAEITNLSFVRSNLANQVCSLHDEMKNLVNRYAWHVVDPTEEDRRDLMKKVIQTYYEPRLEEIEQKLKNKPQPEKGPILRISISDEEWEQWRLEAECLYYHLRVREDDGRAYFNARYDAARRGKHLVRLQFLMSEIDAAIQLYPSLDNIRKIKTAERLWMTGELDAAWNRFQEILNEPNLPLDDQISANNILGQISARRQPQKAEDFYKRALVLAEQQKDKRTAGVLYNNLGQFYTNASRLSKAIESFNEAIKNSTEAGNGTVKASAMNNLAFVYRLQGNLEKALAKYRQAIALRQKLGIERDLAFSYLTKAEIDRDQGTMEEAERNTKLALQIFKKINDIGGQSRAYRLLANIYRYREQFVEAEEYLKNGITLAEQAKDEASLARLYHVYGQEQRRYALYTAKSGEERCLSENVKSAFEKSETYLHKSQEYARKFEDQRLIAHNEHELAIVYFHSGTCPDKELFALLDKVEEKAIKQEDELLLAHVNELRGDVALRSKDYSAAAQYIGTAAKQMSKYSGREVSHFIERASEHIVDPTSDPNEIQTLAEGILAILKNVDEKTISSLKFQCEDALKS